MSERKKEYPKGKAKSETVRIPTPMHEAIEVFLKTPKAKQMGYRHKIDVVTAAVRDLLEKYGFYEETAESPRE